MGERWRTFYLGSTRTLLRDRELVRIRSLDSWASARYRVDITDRDRLLAIQEALLTATRVRFFHHHLFPAARHRLCLEFRDGEQRIILIGDPPQEKLFAANITMDRKRFVIDGGHLKRAFPLSDNQTSMD